MPFPDLPGKRLAYDTDGTSVFLKSSLQNGGQLNEVHPTARQALNTTVTGGMYIGPTICSYFVGGGAPSPNYILFLFPVPMQITGAFFTAANIYYGPLGAQDIYPLLLMTSSDSTNGDDGTWASAASLPQGGDAWTSASVSGVNAVDALTGQATIGYQRTVTPFYRESQGDGDGVGFLPLSGAALRNVSALRMHNTGPGTQTQYRGSGTYVIHLYGAPEPGVSDQRLDIYQVGADLPVDAAFLNWGDVPQGSSGDKSFRIKNLSAAKSAQNITVYTEDLWGYPIPSPASEFLFSADGTTWSSTVNLTELGPAAATGTYYIRRVTPSNASLSTWSPKIRFDVGGWV